MLQLDPELLLDYAGKVTRLKMYPYFDIAHYALSCVAVRDDLAAGTLSFCECALILSFCKIQIFFVKVQIFHILL